MMTLEQLKYPIGKYIIPELITEEIFKNWVSEIESFPSRISEAVRHLSEDQLNTPYRPEGWTVRQVVHHCADSHMNGFIRFKLALTEENPIIKPYKEALWAEHLDYHSMPVETSLNLLKALHLRWTILLRSLTETDLQRTFVHPEYGRTYLLKENTGLYAWHCNHHLAHITELKKREKWD